MKKICLVAAWLAASLSFFPLASADEDDDEPQPVMVDAANGWRVHALSRGDTVFGHVIEHTTDGGKHWQDVSSAALRRENQREKRARHAPDLPGFSVVDARQAWMQIGSGSEDLLLEYTDDGGKHWQQQKAHLKDFDGHPTAFTSFVDKDHGFLLEMGEPAAGHMDKAGYATEDGGRHWHALGDLPDGQYYPTGITFRTRQQGWITGVDRGGPAVSFYRTTDGGGHWEPQPLPFPEQVKELLGGDAYPPVFTGPDKQQGRVRVNLVWKDSQKADGQTGDDFVYETGDGGATWHLPASGSQPTPGQ